MMPFDNEGIRDAIKKYSPPWLADGVAEKFLYVMGLTVDGFLDGANESVKARMPGVGDPSALKYIGSDRVIARGEGESDESYAARLQRAFPTWREAGGAGAILRQFLAFLQQPILARTISNTAAWDWIEAGAVQNQDGNLPVLHYLSPTNNFNWDGDTTSWWRAWVILYSDSGVPWSSEGTWGDGQVWGDGGVWGLTATDSEVRSLRLILGQWKAAHNSVPWIIVVLDDDALFDPFGASTPDGTWGAWSTDVAAVRVPSRASDCRFIDGFDRGY